MTAASASIVIARQRILARRVDVGEHDLVGGGQRVAELAHQVARAAVAMRLERHDDARRLRRASGRQHRGDLGGMMAVVVDHANAVDLADSAESAAPLPEIPPSRLRMRSKGSRAPIRRRRRRARSAPNDGPPPAGAAVQGPDGLRAVAAPNRPCRRWRSPRARTSMALTSTSSRGQAVGDDSTGESRSQRQQLRIVAHRPRRFRRTAPCWRSRRTPAAGRRSCRRPPCARDRCW